MQRHLLLGTAGHIDHGKTSLIRALTGADTDRLPEEKRRGITVDLGFASLPLEGTLLGMIDVPGHERFVKNMLAGAMGIDLGLLVVAADEGVMPQTREHFEALSYLDLSAGVIAITKCDLVESDMMELVEEEIRELVAGSFLQNCSIVHVSTKTELGLGDLRTRLSEAASSVPEQRSDGPFKLSIDRCFSVSGQGTVVTGSVANGSCEVGDSLQLLLKNEVVTVRKIESHGETLQSIGKGQRVAMNLTGVHFSAIRRGDVLSTPGSMTPSKLLSVQLSASRFATRPVKNLVGIRFYSGATETPGRIRLLEADTLAVGASQLAQIELEDPVSTTWGEPFVIRGLAANEVLGGGQIIDPCAFRLSYRDLDKIERLRALEAGDSSQRIAALVALIGPSSWTIDELWQRAGIIDAQPAISQLVAAGELFEFDCKGKLRWLHRSSVEKLYERLFHVLEKEHQRANLSPMVPLGRLKQFFQALQPTDLLPLLAEQLHRQGRIRMDGELVALADWRPQLSANQSALLEQLLSTCQQAGLTVPSVGECAEQFVQTPDEVESLLQVAASSGDLIRMPDKDSRDAKASQRARLYLHRDAIEVLRDRVSTAFSANDPWTVSQFAEALGLSRKYAIPLCGYLDQTGVTVRRGDLRQLVSADSMTS